MNVAEELVGKVSVACSTGMVGKSRIVTGYLNIFSSYLSKVSEWLAWGLYFFFLF